VHTALLRDGLRARPVDRASLRAATGLTMAEVRAALTALHGAGAIYLEAGAISAAYPFSFQPTLHRISIHGVTLFACCAVDALAVPPMCATAAEVASACGHCGAPIRVMMHGELVFGARPETPVVFYPSRECCEAGPAVLTRCPHINFFCGRDHAARWQAARPDLQGTVFTLGEAAAFARDHFAAIIQAVRLGDQ